MGRDPRRWIVASLEHVCGWVDRGPWGCLLATQSYRLDQRWGTGVWFPPHSHGKYHICMEPECIARVSIT